MTILLSPVLRAGDNGRLIFWCPACQCTHSIRQGDGHGPRWTWDGNVDKPTFTPSVRVVYPANPDAPDGFEAWRTERCCHFFVTRGHIQYLADCTHALANFTLAMQELPEDWRC